MYVHEGIDSVAKPRIRKESKTNRKVVGKKRYRRK